MFSYTIFKKKLVKENLEKLTFLKISIFSFERASKLFEQDNYECLMTDLQSFVHNPLKIKFDILYFFRRFYDKQTPDN